MSNLNSVVNVSIQLQTGAALGESFDYVCLIGPLPAAWSPWSPSAGYTVGQMAYNGTHVYRCKTAGTSAASGGPTATDGDIIDGIDLTPVIWDWKESIDPTDIPAGYVQWEPSTSYEVGDICYNGENAYDCVTAGTSASVGGPVGTDTGIVDGITSSPVVWNYVQELPPEVGIYNALTDVSDAGWVTVGATADPVGLAAAVAFSQNPKPDKLYIAYQQWNGEEIESVGLTLARARKFGGWYVVCPAGVPENQFETMAQWVEADTLLFGYTFTGDTDPVGSGYYRSFGFDGKVTDTVPAGMNPDSNSYLSVGAAVKCLSYQSGSETWAYKSLGGLTPSDFSATHIALLEAANLNYYEKLAGLNVTRNGKVKAGEWIDIIRFRDWLENDMRVRVATVLLSNPKIPYTDSGIALVKAAMVASLMQGQTNGGISETTIATDGSLIPGFEVSVPAAANISAADKAARILNNCKFEAYLSGAIHVVKILGYLSYLG